MPTVTDSRVETDYDKWWTVGEVARALSLSTQRVQHYSRIGKFQYVQTRFGKVFNPASVKAFAEESGRPFIEQVIPEPRTFNEDY